MGRTFVNHTVQIFRDKGMIATRRGVIEILDEPALRRTSCQCTVAIEEHFDRVLHGIYPAG